MQVTFRKHGEIWQWDRNRRLICVGMDDPLAWQVHMASPHDDTDAYVLLPYRAEDGEICVDIPNVLMQKPGLVAVYAYHVATKEKHTHTCYTFSVNRREMPADYVYTETELWDWQAIEQAERQRVEAEAAREERMRLCIEAAAAATAEADLAAENAKSAAENVKDGYTPQKGVDYFTEEEKQEIIHAAAAEAANEVWEHVDTITLEEEVAQAYLLREVAFKKLRFYVTVPSGGTGNFNYTVWGKQTDGSSKHTVAYARLTDANSFADMSIENGMLHIESHSAVGQYSQYHNYALPITAQSIMRVRADRNGAGMLGVTFDIWGVRV